MSKVSHYSLFLTLTIGKVWAWQRRARSPTTLSSSPWL